jgi:glucose/arabinose dehydrogenase
MKILLFIVLFVLIATMIFSPSYALDKGQRNYANKSGISQNGDKKVQLVPVEQSSRLSSNVEPINSKSNFNLDANQTLLFNQSSMFTFDLASFVRKDHESCLTNFKCTVNFSSGWKDNTSIQFSTNNTHKKTSRIVGQEVIVQPKESYRLVIHMKLSEWATHSRIELEGLNGITKRWYSIDPCPTYAFDGPMKWQEFSCGLAFEPNTTKVRPVIEAGWSSESKREATTWFDSIDLVKSKQFLIDPNLMTQVVYQGLHNPVSMAFLDPNDFLVIESKGTVQRIINGVKLAKPIHNLDVARDGLLGIAINKNMSIARDGTNKETTYVFLYFTEFDKYGDKSLHNRLYRYEFVNNTLVQPKLLLDLPPGFYHNGGPILIGPDKFLYIMIGELDNTTITPHIKNRALNYEGNDAKDPDGRGGILRIDQNGQPIGSHGIVADSEPLNKYYAYGIRNGFGMDFDPLNGQLWDTENGPSFGDEINLVEPGFNSGWNKVQGIWNHFVENHVNARDITFSPSDLVDFGGRGMYRSPEFIWKYTVGPTALKFLSSDKLGKEYQNDIFVGDVNNGRIYHFKLNQNRTEFILDGPLNDKVADTDTELDSVVFAGGFGIITDLKTGPDGYLYFIAYNEGKIYRIVPHI